MALFRPAWPMLHRFIGSATKKNCLKISPTTSTSVRSLVNDDSRQPCSDNPYYKKYADKIKELERQNPEKFKRRQDEVSQNEVPTKTSEFKQHPNDAQGDSQDDRRSQQEPTYVRPSKFDADAIRELRSRCKTTSELADAWKSLHAERDAVCAVIPSSVYDTIRERARDYPVFLYPLPRNGGYEFVLSQFVGDQCHMTPLANYQRHGSEAPACLALSYWTQLAAREEGAVVLMSGEYDAKVIGPAEAQCLVNQLQLYYGKNELKKKLLLWNFNREPRSFNHEALIREFEASLSQEQAESSSVG
ncbi:ATP synthase mitochondrial F1 complex assembly factor 1 [Haemaphysalis longicornis]